MWYEQGLRFECTQCGDCCTGAPGYVWMTVAEIERLAAHLGMDRDAFGKRYLRRIGRRYSLIEKANGDCVFWNRGCTVYAARPDQCRTFPFWPENLRDRDAWRQTSDHCPGIGCGQLYAVDRIERIRRGEEWAASDA
jgi:hypothetical protein